MIFTLIALFILAVGLISLCQAKKMEAATDEIRSVWLPSMISLGNVGAQIGWVRALTLRSLIIENEAERERIFKMVDDVVLAINLQTGTYEKTIQSTEERRLFEEFSIALATYQEYQGKILKTNFSGQGGNQLAVMEVTLDQHANSLMIAIKNLNEYNVAGVIASAKNSGDSFNSALSIIVASLLIALFMMIVVAVLLVRSIIFPLADAMVVASRISNGDLTQEILVSGRDEPAQLLTAMRKMQNSLRDTIHQISSSSDQLASASEELHAVTEGTNCRLAQQSVEIDQAATAVNEMCVAVEEVASSAVNASDASREADKKAHEGRTKVNQALDSIRVLANNVSATSQEVKQLAENINEIGQVLDVIRSIADQTNLLALNAAIEAARAGLAGRGFAVVADEVRALAHRTQESTAEIESMIVGIQSGTERAVVAMAESQERAATTLDVAKAANDALELIGEAIASINQKNLIIASASEEQAQVSREVDRNIVNIRDLSMQTSAGANQTSAASQDLSLLAVKLNTMISKFKI